eukprot:GFUD01134949.1.p1 GENE.GFUD01134949.1~~GFUD01134949.1.p1  ORF type:complete len:254 (-),score=67.67 GFUD01134949.1:65-826(-)
MAAKNATSIAPAHVPADSSTNQQQARASNMTNIKMSDTTIGLLTLPNDVFAKICSFLPPYSVSQLELSCSEARQAVEVGSIWRRQVEQLARETSCGFLCSMLALAKERECRVPAVFKSVLRVRIKINMMLKEIKTWLYNFSGAELCFIADAFGEANPECRIFTVKKWEAEVLPIVKEHGEDTDYMLAKIFEEGIKECNRKLCSLNRVNYLSLEFSVRLEANVLAVYLTKMFDESDTDEWSDGQVEIDTDDDEN